MRNGKLTHVNRKGEARMVDITEKEVTDRIARATGRVLISSELLKQLKADSLAKGDALAVARIAGIQAAKRTAELIPLCHQLPLSEVEIDISLKEKPASVVIETFVRTAYRTGVEMEALTAASVAALAIYDMGKSIDRGMVIENIRLIEKKGGRSGHWKIRKAGSK